MAFGLLRNRGDAKGLPSVDLIQEPSRGDVLSNVAAGADGVTGDLRELLAGVAQRDRDDTAAFARFRRHATRSLMGSILRCEQFTAAAALLTAGRPWPSEGASARL